MVRTFLQRLTGAVLGMLIVSNLPVAHGQTQVAAGGRKSPVYYPAPVQAAPCPTPVVTPVPSTLPGQRPMELPEGVPQPGQGGPQAPGDAPQAVPDAAAAPEAAPATDTAAPATSADAGGFDAGSGSAVAMGGRIDALGRFNLFDNMSAIPQSRVFFQFLYGSSFDTGFRFQQQPGVEMNPRDNLAQNRNFILYRAGGEYAVTKNFSVAGQAVYAASTATSTDHADSWGNPQVMAKYAFVNTCDTVLSATLGGQFQVSTSRNEIHETTTRIMPGVLAFQSLTDDLFFQGGFQGNIATASAPNTVDWAVSLGYWLYRDPGLDTSGRALAGAGCSSCNRRWIRGIIPQVELFGKHVIGNAESISIDTIPLFVDVPAPPVRQINFGAIVPPGGTVKQFRGLSFSEPKDVIDLTAGVRILISRASINVDASVPLTGGQVRDFEFFSGINFFF